MGEMGGEGERGREGERRVIWEELAYTGEKGLRQLEGIAQS